MMMHLGLFAAAATLAVVSAEIDGIGATNLPIVPAIALLEPKTNVTKKETAPAAKEKGEHATYFGQSVRETLEGIEKNSNVKSLDMEKVTNTDLDSRTAMESGTDDENSTDWIK
jgi:hypothetical protein